MSRIMIIGAGALAREVHSHFNSTHDIIGFLDKPLHYGEKINGCPVLRTPQPNCKYVIAVGDAKRKRSLSRKYSGYRFTSLIHPTAVIGLNTRVPDGAVIFPYAVVDPDVKICRHVFIGCHAFVGHHSEIGECSSLCNYVAVSGHTKLESAVYMGTHSVTVNERWRERCVVLGSGCVVGAGAVVTESVEKGETVVGIPAKPL